MTGRATCYLVLPLLLGISLARVLAGEEIEPAPEQMPQHTFLSAHPSMFAPEAVFAGKVYQKPDFLPPESYEADAMQKDSHAISPQHSLDNSIKLAQYPIDDSAATDSYIRPEPLIDTATPNSQSIISPDVFGGWLDWNKPSFVATVLPQSSDGLGITTLDARITAVPKSFPLLQFTPRFSTHFVSGPESTDLPGQLYDFALDTSLFMPINERWSFLGGVAPNMFSDFENTSSEALRITGRGLFFYKYSDQLKLAVGIIYLNRDDISLIPAAGLVYTPHERLKLDLMFPKPKLAYRFQTNGTMERWAYAAAEFGGGTWAIQRTTGLNDVVTYRDYKFLAGFEHIQTEGYRWFAEAGYVFGRELEYTSNLGNTDLTSTGVIRLGITF